MDTNTIREALNNEIATRLIIAASSLAQWLSLHDTRRKSEINEVLVDTLLALEHQCQAVRAKLELPLKSNK